MGSPRDAPFLLTGYVFTNLSFFGPLFTPETPNRTQVLSTGPRVPTSWLGREDVGVGCGGPRGIPLRPYLDPSL